MSDIFELFHKHTSLNDRMIKVEEEILLKEIDVTEWLLNLWQPAFKVDIQIILDRHKGWFTNAGELRYHIKIPSESDSALFTHKPELLLYDFSSAIDDARDEFYAIKKWVFHK